MPQRKRITVGIIGGTGNMGSFFAKFFRKTGCKVLVASHETKFRPEALAAKSDLVIFSVPISKTVRLIRKYAPFIRPGCAVADFTSIKVAPVKAMLCHAQRGVEVIGLHPVFGPMEKGLRGQTIVVTPGRGRKWKGWLIKKFRKAGARVKVCSPEKHDRMMAVIQGLTHFPTLAVGLTFKKLGANLNETLEFTSPIYRTRLALIARILSQEPQLYADILTLNPYCPQAIREYMRAARKTALAVERRDSAAFARCFREAAAYFKRSRVKPFLQPHAAASPKRAAKTQNLRLRAAAHPKKRR